MNIDSNTISPLIGNSDVSEETMKQTLTEDNIAFALVWNLINDQQSVYAWFFGMYVVSTLLPPLLPPVFTVLVGILDE